MWASFAHCRRCVVQLEVVRWLVAECGGVRRGGRPPAPEGCRSDPTLGGWKATAKCTFHPFGTNGLEETSTMPDPMVPPTPPVSLDALLAREDLGLRRVAGPSDPGI